MARDGKGSNLWDFLKWLIGGIVILAIFCMTFGMVNLGKDRE